MQKSPSSVKVMGVVPIEVAKRLITQNDHRENKETSQVINEGQAEPKEVIVEDDSIPSEISLVLMSLPKAYRPCGLLIINHLAVNQSFSFQYDASTGECIFNSERWKNSNLSDLLLGCCNLLPKDPYYLNHFMHVLSLTACPMSIFNK